jgi:hypothetical protein
MDEISQDWIKEFEEKEREYDFFYKDEVKEIDIFILYINSSNEIDKIRKEHIFLDDSIIPRQKLIDIIHSYKKNNDIPYNFSTLIKYNITLDPENIEDYALSEYNENYIEIIKNVEDLKFQETITTFHDINTLYLVFQENTKDTIIEKSKKLKRSNTKRIYLTNKHRKTKKRNLKV